MPIASRTRATMVAGILGGSGPHVVQIIIGIVVGVALIGFLLSFFLSGRGSRRRPSVGGAMVGEATLRLSRVWSGNAVSGFGSAQGERWNIALDGRVAGTIAYQETVEVSLAPGRQTLRLGQGRHLSRPRTFDIAEGEVVSFRCHGPRWWPLWLAALVK